MKVFVHTLGCRLNYYETEALLDEFIRRAGASRVKNFADADIIIVNTCVVTARSTARSRKAVRYFHKHTDAEIAVTGCVVQVSPDEFTNPKTILIPNTEKQELVTTLSKLLDIPLVTESQHKNDNVLFPQSAPTTIARTRASLKIQDGCDNNCSYCIVPQARGHSRSQPREIVLKQAEQLSRAGYREILLTGVDLVAYGRDIYSDYSYRLPELVRNLLELGGFRIRLSSTEPIGLTPDMLRRISLPGICRHFHLPIQSGSDTILESMGRQYTRDDIIELLNSFSNLFPGVCIGADIIVGFPGETEGDFNDTVDLISHPAISYLHVFPFSPRPGTPAAEMKPLHRETITQRAKLLRKHSEDARNRFRKSRIGEDVIVLTEGRFYPGTDTYMGMSDNYIPVIVPPGFSEGDLLTVTLEDSNICWASR